MFRDVITELTEAMLKSFSKGLKKGNPMLCQSCKKALIKKQSVFSHYCEVAAFKFVVGAISAIDGEATSAIPAPDYRFSCPKCGAMYALIEGKFVMLKKGSKQSD